MPVEVPTVIETGASTEGKRDATVMELARVIADSRDFPSCRSPEKAAVRILAGRELGIGAIASVMGIRIEAGRVSMDACLMAGLIERSSRYDFRVKERDDSRCVLEFLRDGQVRGEASFTVDEAKAAGLTKKDVWRSYSRDMVYWRAVSRGARQYCPGIFGSAVYVHEELGLPVDAEGRILDGESGGESSEKSELCTRDQRQRIVDLNTQIGGELPELLTKLGIRLLDELSGYEADKLIRKLEKKAGTAATATTTQPEPQPSVEPAATAQTTTDPQAAVADPVTQAVQDGFNELERLCTRSQQNEIRQLAEKLEPDEEARYEMLSAALAKRGCQKIAELDRQQALSLIEAMQAKVKEIRNAPFVKKAKPAATS